MKTSYLLTWITFSCLTLLSCGGGNINFGNPKEIIETMKRLPLTIDYQKVVLVKGGSILSASFSHSDDAYLLYDETQDFVYSGSKAEFHARYSGYEYASLKTLDTTFHNGESFLACAAKALGDAKIMTAKDFFPSAIAAVESVKEMIYYKPFYHFALDRTTKGYATLLGTLRAFLPASFVEEYEQKTAPAIELFYLENGDRHMGLCSIEGNGSFLPRPVLPYIS